MIPSEIKEEHQVVVLPLALRIQNLINRFIKLDTLRAKGRTTTLREVSSSWLSKDDKPDFLAKYSSNQNEPKNKNIDNKIIDIFAVNELSPESSGEDIEDEK